MGSFSTTQNENPVIRKSSSNLVRTDYTLFTSTMYEGCETISIDEVAQLNWSIASITALCYGMPLGWKFEV
jgi:hypothetical protein